MDVFKEAGLLFIALPVYSAAIFLEIIISNIRHVKVYTFWGIIENVLLSLLNAGIDGLIRGGVFVFLSFFYDHRFFNLHQGIIYWTLLLIGEDFLYYWLHRIDHQCRVFWAIHVTHHSSEEFNFTVGFRSSVFQPLYRFIYFIPLPLLGFHVADIFLVYSIMQLYGILLHTQLIGRLGWLESVLVTPSHHRVHHGSNERYIDRNYGMMLIVWDRMFGSFEPESEPVRYGITKPLEDHRLFNTVFHEWKSLGRDIRQGRTIAEKIKCILGRPGDKT
jgi:sterol desaturase/sphingolipid hydroxylase (fatty acid hydroxylase superfamily)